MAVASVGKYCGEAADKLRPIVSILACFLALGVSFRVSEVPHPPCRPCPSRRSAGSATINTITMPKTESNRQSALLSIEKVLTLLRSVQALEGTDKDGVEHLLEMAVENLKK